MWTQLSTLTDTGEQDVVYRSKRNVVSVTFHYYPSLQKTSVSV